jgi:transcription antitermination factor NusG
MASAIDHSSKDSSPHWYAAYTCVRHEKRVVEYLKMKQVEVFLPLYKSIRSWNGRKAEVELPLFAGYVFVRLPLAERLKVLTAPGVVHLVSSQAAPLEVPEYEIKVLQDCLARANDVQPHSYLERGTRVRITDGPLAGLEGVVLRQHGRTRVVITVESIMKSVAVEVESCMFETVDLLRSAA